MLNINATLNTDATSREALVADVLDEFNQISFRDFQGALKRWHEGSLSVVHLNVLMALRGGQPMTMSHLAEMLDVSVASATGIVDRMEKKGVVERRHSEADRRVVEVHLTERGRAVFLAMRAERQVRLTSLLAEISDDDLAALLRGLRAFRVARERILANLPDETKKAHGT
jgi:DNA-binding MarR family transcriptional regulator